LDHPDRRAPEAAEVRDEAYDRTDPALWV
jgi:hypothetical protein